MKKIITIGFLVTAFSAKAVTLKFATLVPEGTNWADTIGKMAKEIRSETETKVKVFYGGVQGDEPDVLRKIRIGQLHGGVFTGKTLGDIVFDARTMEVPFSFYNDEEKVTKFITQINEKLSSSLESKGFVNLGFYEIGKVYVVTTKKVNNLKEMKNIKIWAWEGDKLIAAMMESIGLLTVPLALPDVLSSMSTGIIDGAYAPPLGVLALQWQTQIKYLIDFPAAYSVGALLVSSKAWNKIGPQKQSKIRQIAKKYIQEANKLAKQDNAQALEQLKAMGVEFVSFPKEDLAKAETIRNDVLKKLSDRFSSDMINKLNEAR